VLNRKVQQSVVANEIPEAYSYALYTGSSIDKDRATNLNITGSEKESATNFPTVDFAYYKSIASPGQDISGNYTFSAGTYSGIWYINGNVTISSNVTINGSVITTGKIDGSRASNVVVNPTSTYPSLIANNNIDFSRSTNVTISKLIYAGADGSGSLDFSRATTVNLTGTIIAYGAIDLSRSDSVTITYSSSIITDPPPGISGGGGGGAASISVQKDWNEIVPAI